MEKYILEWQISDYKGRRGGEIVTFQNKKLSLCKGLTAWCRLDKYLIRFYDVLWFAGYEDEELFEISINELLQLFEKYINDFDIIKMCKNAEKFTTNKERFFYGRVNSLSKSELDKISDEIILKYFKHLTKG